MNIIERVADIKEKFSKIVYWEDKYKFIIEQGKNLPGLDESKRLEQNKVKGCQSQVWLHAEVKDGKILFQGDSDAAIVKGLLAMLIGIYSDSTPEEILNLKPTFVDEIGLREHLSMTRSSGLSAMLKQFGFYALAFQMKIRMEKK